MTTFLYRLFIAACVILAVVGFVGLAIQNSTSVPESAGAQTEGVEAGGSTGGSATKEALAQLTGVPVQMGVAEPSAKEAQAGGASGGGLAIEIDGPPSDPRYQVVQDWIETFAPAYLVQQDLLGLAYWQWIALFLFIFIAVLIDFSVQTLLRLIIHRQIREQGAKTRREELRRTTRPFGLYAAAIFCQLALDFLQFEGVVYEVAKGALAVFSVLAGVVSALRLIDLVGSVLTRHAEATTTRVDDIVIPLVRKTLKIFVIAIGLLYGANTLGIEVWPLIASLGIGGVAFAFAAKDTVENFFGSVAVLVDRPFDIGDWVVVDQHEGMVESVGFRSTRIRTFYNSQITVPNANLVRAIVDNYGRRKYRRWKSTLSLQYDTPPDKLLAFAEGVRELIRHHPYTRKDYYQVWVNEFNSSSIDTLLYLFFEVPDWSTELRERERLLVDIVRLADTIGVSFAFPTTTVHLYKEEGPPGYGQHEAPGRMSDRRAMITGMRAARQLIADQPWRSEVPPPVDYGHNDLEGELDAAGNPIEKPKVRDKTGQESVGDGSEEATRDEPPAEPNPSAQRTDNDGGSKSTT
ncbi:mechanosensitive ion channel family protein [Mucisphaera sp.]|uniref:mechanosensitive ion channel family protein n=1 Tax=Mucisphaera sp. TaxID=2913024 RepID=UPI003D0C20D1